MDELGVSFRPSLGQSFGKIDLVYRTLEQQTPNNVKGNKEQHCVFEVHVVDQVRLNEVVEKLDGATFPIFYLEHRGNHFSNQQIQFDAVDQGVNHGDRKGQVLLESSTQSPVYHQA